MKSVPFLAVAMILALITIFVVPSVTYADPGDPLLQAAGVPIADFSHWATNARQSANAGDHAIYVRESGTYADDGVVLPVLEALEARYAAADREFTVEYWFKFRSGYSSDGKELFDHHIPSEEGFWTAFQNGQLWSGIDTEPGNDSSAIHIHTGSGFNDGEWHHYALVRDLSASPDCLCLYLDGAGECYEDGSQSQWAHVDEDIRPSNNRDGNPDNDYPLYTVGARTSGSGEIEATIDELRISDVARYRGGFIPSSAPFVLDANTVMLFHFDEGSGNTTYGYDSDSNSIEGTLVRDSGWYGTDAPPLDPGNPSEAAWLDEMWVDGRFGTISPSSLKLISPNGYELWLTDTEYQIAWTSTGVITDVSLSYSTDGFATINETIVASTPDDGVYTWMTPPVTSNSVRVRVADADNPAIYDDSDANFILTEFIYPCCLPLVLRSWW